MSKSLRQEVEDLNDQQERNESPLDPVVYNENDSVSLGSAVSTPSLLSSKSSTPVYPFAMELRGDKKRPADLSCSLQNIAAILARAFIESVIFGIFLCVIPAASAFAFTSAELYNIFTERWDHTGFSFNPVMEFVRMTMHVAGMYAIWVHIDATTKIVPLFIRRSWHMLALPLPNAVKTTLAGWKASRSAINLALFGFTGLLFTDFLLFGSSKLVSSATDAASATIKDLSLAQRRVEKILIALASLSFMCLFQKMAMQLITISYRKQALAPRILGSNFKFRVLTRLFRQTNLGEIDARRSIARERAREALHPADEDFIEISKDIAGLHLRSKARAVDIASALWARICPIDRDYIVQEDLQSYFTLEDVPEAFVVFDLNNTGIINSATWTESIVAIWNDRRNLQSSVKMSDATLGILESIINTVILAMWALSVLGCISPSGYAFITGTGGLVLGLGFLFKDSCEKVFKSFIFVLVEHPFDIGDTVIIDKTKYSVLDIQLFQTTFRKLTDSTVTYIPNSSLVAKYIYNEDRSEITTESLLVTLPSMTSLTALGALQAAVNTFLSESFATYTGSVFIRPLEVQDGKMNVRVECRFQDSVGLEKEVKIARKDILSHRIQNYLKEHSIK